jgi:hypothetical protein
MAMTVQKVVLADGVTVSVKLLSLVENHDPINHSVRDARVQVDINGEKTTLHAGNYNLPTALGPARIDCSVTKGYGTNVTNDFWGLRKDARLRLWPARIWRSPSSRELATVVHQSVEGGSPA